MGLYLALAPFAGRSRMPCGPISTCLTVYSPSMKQTALQPLYGSTARGTATLQSDVDIALLITRPLTLRQQDALSDLVTDLNLKYDKVLSVVDIDLHTYLHWRHVAPFYQNVDKDGIVLWKAA